MTEVTFHFNVPEKTAYACRLLRKAWAARAPVGVLDYEIGRASCRERV